VRPASSHRGSRPFPVELEIIVAAIPRVDLAQRGVHPQVEAQRLRAPAAHRPDGDTAIPGLIESLTAREVEVLGLMAAGRSNRRIADELVVTLDTAKKHVLDKLGADYRTEAVTRGRQLGLIR
jgi:ATP/maltotriose-dependent transcriptional regulator MalT